MRKHAVNRGEQVQEGDIEEIRLEKPLLLLGEFAVSR
jgi:hypothetical protein